MCSQVWAAQPSVSEFTQSMSAYDGYIPFYYDESSDKIYLRINKLDTEMLLLTSLPQGVGSNDIGLDRGQLGMTQVIKFERHGNKVLMKALNTRYRSETANTSEQASIDEAFADSVLAGFSVKAASGDEVVIDYTPYLLSDVHGVGDRLARRKQGNFKADPARSAVFMARTRAFPKNTELESIVTFAGTKPGEYVQQVTPAPKSITVHLHHAFIELPDDNYTPRAYHPYSGYWKRGYFDYATAITESTEVKFITRHRLYKKDVNAEKSEPVEPIIYYLDPGVPEPVMSALKEGALWWNDAFEAIGYDNAFQVKVLPEGADPMDIRYNMINWVHRATRGWSYGSSVKDPRTGEIIKGNVTLGSLRVRQDYLIALGLTSPYDGEQTTDAQREMALARIRQLSAHEVGHTLGIAHNFAASENGRESVMDYPHPKMSIKRGKIVLDDAYDTGMGEWDMHTIAYGYQDYASPEAEAEGLAALIAATRDTGIAFKNDWDTRAAHHPSSNGHMWDNGKDPLDAFDEIVSIRSLALEKFGLTSIAPGASLSSLEDTLVPVYLLHRYQLEAVAKQVGGLVYEYERKGDYPTPKGVQPVAGEQQKRAVKKLLQATSPEFLRFPDELLKLIPPTAFGDDVTREQFNSRMGLAFDPVSAAEAAANFSFTLLLHPERLNRLMWQSAQVRGIPSPGDVVERIFSQHWYEKNQAEYGVNARLRLVALNAVMTAVTSKELAPEAKLSMDSALLKLSDWLDDKGKLPGAEVLHQQLELYFETGEWVGGFEAKALPPGSPI
ncbi:zinc-dependent metalloprotease [Aestuariibacter sp. A3R04]|uniref:zinc-dependent metalloprotease n=1 Tax=Aestuariibacter sp. A3R04 TaxID=2841571 RepID=UPI001C09E376|nr:zinc-dependent metalloprotease [Aestuariibacter sp. A3R04]MBU3023197.1 zinc-dependent metalloprotease [Aestuariibacter sp. A3R04]